MTTTTTRETAKVYAFPQRGRAGNTATSREPLSDWDIQLLQLPEVEFGSGWYHDAAIAESEPAGKHTNG